MSKTPQDTDLASWHKFFAIECNNRAWDLACRSRTAAEDQEMRLAAHAAAFHWNVVGEELHRMRATMLLAEVCALLGDGAAAMRDATVMREFFRGIESPDWEAALVHTIHAHAAAVCGDTAAHTESYAAAVAAVEAIADPEDAAIVRATFDQVPRPTTGPL